MYSITFYYTVYILDDFYFSGGRVNNGIESLARNREHLWFAHMEPRHSPTRSPIKDQTSIMNLGYAPHSG